MVALGLIALYGALLCALLTIVVGVIAGRGGNVALGKITERALMAMAYCVFLAVAVLQYELITLNFTLSYVAEHTSSTLNVFYRVGSMWAGQGGSLMLWALVLSLGSLWTLHRDRVAQLEMSPYTWTIFATVAGMFVAFIAFLSSPFEKAPPGTTEGMGLNPLLQNPLQLIHPIALYGGYVLYTIPFAVIMGQLLAGKVEGPWTSFARTWNILSWTLLTIGIILGARWAYAELGWGGYWGWDPVENASLIPWLAGTAALHTGLTYREPRRLRLTSVAILVSTFNLCLFGTFLTRSGVIQSVHAFATSNLGAYLGVSVAGIALASAAILVWRMPEMQFEDPNARGQGWLSQKILTVLMLSMTIAVLWGTIFPLFARAFKGQEIAVTPGFFKVVVTPLAVLVLVLFAISPLLPGQSLRNRKSEIMLRSISFIGVFIGVFGITKFQHPNVALVFAIVSLALFSILSKAIPRVSEALKDEKSPLLSAAQASSPFIAHIGLIVMLTAITLNVSYQSHGQEKLTLNQTKQIGTQLIRLDAVQSEAFADRKSYTATVSLMKTDAIADATIVAKLDQYNNAEQLQAEVGIHTSLTRDIYVVVDEIDAKPGQEYALLSVYDNPAVIWLWIGGILIALGGALYALQSVLRSRTTNHPRTKTVSLNSRQRTQLGIGVVLILISLAYVAGRATSPQRPGADASMGKPNAAPSPSQTALDRIKVASLEKRIAQDPKDSVSIRELGNAYFTSGDFASSLKYFRMVTQVTPSDDSAWIAVGAAAFNLADDTTAKTAWEQAAKINPKNSEAHYNLGFWYLAQKPADEVAAKKEWARVVEIDPNSVFATNVAQHLSSLATASPQPTK